MIVVRIKVKNLFDFWFAARRAVLPLLLVSMTGSAATSGVKCGSTTAEEMRSINSKEDMEDAILRMIPFYRSEGGGIDWVGLSNCFKNFGDRFSVVLYPGGGRQNSDVFRFSFDNSGVLSYLFGVPGGSNGVFTAIFIQASNGDVAIIRRGGDEKWLKFE